MKKSQVAWITNLESQSTLYSRCADNRSDLVDRTLSAIKWEYLGVIARIVLQFVAVVVLARLLGPQKFGLFGATILVVGLGNLLCEMGLGAALVQKTRLSAEDIRIAFTWLMLTSFVLSILVFLGAGAIATLFAEKELERLLRVATLVFIAQAVGVVSFALLRRRLDMRSIQLAQVVSYVVGFPGIGVLCALLGVGALSLVLALLTQVVIASLMAYGKTRHSIKPLFRRRTAHQRSFGHRVLFVNLANLLIENADNFIVGKFVGMSALGLYSVAYNLVRTPTNHLVVALQRVIFPASAASQENTHGLRRTFLTAVSGLSLVTLPIFTCVGFLSDAVVSALYGEKWLDAGPLLFPLALAMPLHAVMAVGGPVLCGKGLVGLELKIQAWVAAVFVIAAYAAAQFSLEALAWSVFALYFLRAVWMIQTVLQALEVSWLRFLLVIRGGLFLSVVAVPGLLGIEQLLSVGNMPVAVKLPVEALTGASLVIVIYAFFGRIILAEETIWLLHRIGERAPARFRNLFMRCLPVAKMT